MRHRLAGKRLSRTTSHRIALRRNMAASLIQHGAIRTTEPKAKELRRFVERLITIAREGTLHARRRVLAKLNDRNMMGDDGDSLEQTVVQKLFDDVAPRFVDRPGGYTRIIRLDERRIGDAAQQVILQLIEESSVSAGSGQGTSRRKRRALKRHEAASTASEEGEVEETAPEGETEPEAAEDPSDTDPKDEEVSKPEEVSEEETEGESKE